MTGSIALFDSQQSMKWWGKYTIPSICYIVNGKILYYGGHLILSFDKRGSQGAMPPGAWKGENLPFIAI